MTTAIKMKCRLRCGKRRRARPQRQAAATPTQGHIPRISKLMALAIRWDRLIREPAVVDYAEIAQVTHLTRARVTQIMNLLNLAPDIQDAVLTLPTVETGKDRLTERLLRGVIMTIDWNSQRDTWAMLVTNHCRTLSDRPLSEPRL